MKPKDTRLTVSNNELHGMLVDMERRLGDVKGETSEAEKVRRTAKEAMLKLQISLLATEVKGRKQL